MAANRVGVSTGADKQVEVGDLADNSILPMSGLKVYNPTTKASADVGDDNPLPVADPSLDPPDGGTIVGDDTAHALGAFTGPGVVWVLNEGSGLVTIGSATRPPTSTSGAPLPPGSLAWRAKDISVVRVFAATGTTVRYGVQQ